MAKHKVTMTRGAELATDYVPDEILQAYVADAETRWDSVEVSEDEDYGPSGPAGETVIPEHLVDGDTT